MISVYNLKRSEFCFRLRKRKTYDHANVLRESRDQLRLFQKSSNVFHFLWRYGAAAVRAHASADDIDDAAFS